MEVIHEIVPLSIDDIRMEQDHIKEKLAILRSGFFKRYGEWEKEMETLKHENEFLKSELNAIKCSRIFIEQEIKLCEFKLDDL